MTNQELGKIAYDAYCEVTDWKSAITGAPLPAFEETPALVQAAWRIAAKAVAATVIYEKKIVGSKKIAQDLDIQEPGIVRELRAADILGEK